MSATPTAPLAAPTAAKPRLRGVSHEIGFYLALVAGGLLVALAARGTARLAALVYALSLVTLLGTSALYHRRAWGPVGRQRMRRLDHAAIFLLIAGTYTPVGLLALPAETGQRLLLVAWAGALVGVVREVAWPKAPKPVVAAVYVFVGWAVALEWGAVQTALGPVGTALLAAGGVLYTVGALVYAFKRPNPAPAVFGYHEVFHALVIAAAVCHFVMVGRLVVA